MASLHLVRHGETTANLLRRLDTAPPGSGLTDFGARQAVRFALENPPDSPVALVASVALRAQQTAELISAVWEVEPVVTEGIHEVQVGELEDRTDDDAHDVFKDVIDRWHNGELDARIPGGESLAMLYERYLPVIDDLAGRYLIGTDRRDVYVVSHGAAIRLIAARLSGVDPSFAAGTHLPNTGSIELEYADDGTWVCRRWGAVHGPFTATVDEPLVSDPMG